MPALGTGRMEPGGLNGQDEIVGRWRDLSGRFHGFLFSGGHTTSIDGRIENLDGFEIQSLDRVNDDGVIVGTALQGVKLHGVMLVPTDGPARRQP